jgi:hypothetical protein
MRDCSKIEGWHRRQALYMSSNLPDGIEDARIVLKLLTELVEGFLVDHSEPESTERTNVNVLTLVKGDREAG